MASSTLFFSYWLLKTHKIEDVIAVSIESIIEDIAKNTELQKNLYQMGALIGNGAKTGIGLSTRGGKLKIEDIVLTAIEGYFRKGQQESSNIGGTLP